MSYCAICGVNRGGRPGGPEAALRRKTRRVLDARHSEDTELNARVSTNINLDAETDIGIRQTATATWIELGSAAIFANDDQLRRLNATLTDYLSSKGPVLKVADMTTVEFLGHVG